MSMQKTITIVAAILFILSCQVPGQQVRNGARDSLTEAGAQGNGHNQYVAIDKSVHFFGNCDSFYKRLTSTEGYLQMVDGGPDFDSTGPFVCAECYESGKSFEVYFAYRGAFRDRKPHEDSLMYHTEDSCANGFRSFNCFAFVLPMVDPDQLPDDSMNITFPVSVKVYSRLRADQWTFVKKVQIDSFPQYTRLVFNTIYGY